MNKNMNTDILIFTGLIVVIGLIFWAGLNIYNFLLERRLEKERKEFVKKYRSIRDAIFCTDNVGRGRKLLLDLPNVEKLEHYLTGDYIKITLEDGSIYEFGGPEDELYYLQQAALVANINYRNSL